MVLDAYRRAAATLAHTDPSCKLPWQLLAGIGRIESNHAWSGELAADGTTLRRIVGPALDRAGFRLNPPWMYRWVKYPQGIKPETRMPTLGLNIRTPRRSPCT